MLDIIRLPTLTSIMEMPAEDFSVKYPDRLEFFRKLNTTHRNRWIALELKFWTNIKEKIEHQEYPSRFLKTISEYLDILRSDGKSLFSNKSIESFQKNQPLPFHDEQPECDFFPDLAENGQLDIAIYTFRASLKNFDRAYLTARSEDLSKIEDSYRANITAETTKLFSEIDNSEQKLNEYRENAEEKISEKLALELEKAKSEINNILTAANKTILSAEPVKYWQERENNHKNKAKKYAWYVISTAIVFFLLLTFLTVSVYKVSDEFIFAGIPISLPTEKTSIALIIIATTGAIWLTRVLVKLMMTNLALEIEALERSTMIKTYIAMEYARGEQIQEIQMLFYTTLFKPSNNNLSDDSTSPEYIRIIEAMLQKKIPDKP